MIFSSIRWRLQAWHALLLTAVVAGFGFTAHRLATINRLRVIDEELQGHVAQLSIAVPPTQGREPPGRRPPSRPGSSFTDSIVESGAWFVVWNGDGSVQARSANAPADLVKPEHAGAGEISFMRTHDAARESIRFTGSGRCFLVGRSIQNELAELTQLAWYLAAAGGGVLAFGLIGGAWLTTRAIRPIADISITAERIAAGDLSRRIPTARSSDELNRLTAVLNSTFARLDAAFTQQQRFTADAAHELRTPVSVILTHAENGLASANLSEEQREAFDACRRASRRMRTLIESLLQLARLDAGQELHSPENIDLAELTHDCVELVQPLAAQRGIQIHHELQSAIVRADAERLMQVLTNLLTNAIQYSREQGAVRVRLHAAELTITDNGPGIAPADLPHIFERFYRADTARSGKDSHSGLGLAISKAIVEAHGSTISASSEPGKGATFTVRLPLA